MTHDGFATAQILFLLLAALALGASRLSSQHRQFAWMAHASIAENVFIAASLFCFIAWMVS